MTRGALARPTGSTAGLATCAVALLGAACAERPVRPASRASTPTPVSPATPTTSRVRAAGQPRPPRSPAKADALAGAPAPTCGAFRWPVDHAPDDSPELRRLRALLPTLAAEVERERGARFVRPVALVGFQPGVPPHDAACAGWAGDRAWVGRAGESALIVWLSWWDSSEDASEFARAMEAVTPRPPSYQDAEVIVDGLRVLLLAGVPRERRAKVRAAALAAAPDR